MNLSILLIPLLLPLAVGIVILFIPKVLKWVRETLTFITMVITFAAVIKIFLMKEASFRFSIVEIGKFNLSLDLLASPLASFILLFATGFGLLVSLYSFRYMEGKGRLREYYSFLLFAVGGSCGVILSDHLLFFLIFWEIVTVSLYFLITTGEPEAKAGATKTFAMIGAGDGLLLLGIGLAWYASGTLTMSSIDISTASVTGGFAFVLMMLGAITKAGSMPLHTWIPAASEGAPASVMAFMPAALDKLLGIYFLLRIAMDLFVMNDAMGMVLMAIGSVTIVAAVMMAMVQHDLRRLLSYHAVSQVGYMVLGIGTMNPIGIIGGLFHMINNSIYKSCLFLCAGSVESRSGSNDLGDLGGLAKAMPVTAVTCLIAALAISGVPPLNGFVSKWLIYQGVIGTGSRASFIFLVAAMFGSALTLASFVKVMYSVFLGQRTETTAGVKKEVGFSMFLPMVVLALLCLFFGIFYRYPLAYLVPSGTEFTTAPTGLWNSTVAAVLIVIGIALGLLIYLIGNIKKSARIVKPFIGGESLKMGSDRVSGTHFYDTVKNMPALKGIYAAQEKGYLDPYSWFAGLGLTITGLLRKLHNGLLPMYLSWSILGSVVLLVLFIVLL
jgi:formate hydrogenlyase subunit 3/multisubunit Na+/H+ antiporter MnhD subunit